MSGNNIYGYLMNKDDNDDIDTLFDFLKSENEELLLKTTKPKRKPTTKK